jgi:RNA polymerase sigma factor (sigma-70 family)
MFRAVAERQDELNLLSGVLGGNAAASDSFFRRYNWTIEMSVRAVLQRSRRQISEDDVSDMVGEIWVSLLEDDKRPLRRYDPARDIRVSTWIGLLARNKTIDRLRTTHDVTVSIEEATEAQEAPSLKPLPPEEIEEWETRRLAARALSQLSEEDGAFMEAWYLEGQTPEVLARRLGISVGATYSRRFKIQQKLTRSVHRLRRSRPRAISPTIH